ncbi:MAG: hypothetical protein ACK500_01575 [Flavobacteriales bacterium]|jgi:hypothetical protein
MRRNLLLFPLLVCAVSGFSQQDSSYIQVGINTARLVTMNRTIQEDIFNPYLLNFEWGNGKVGGRLSANYWSQTDTEKPSSFNGNSSFSDDTTSLDIRLGVFVERSLGKSWSVKWGADFFIAQRDRDYNTVVRDVDGLLVESAITSSRSETGGGLSVIPEWHITPRITLSTELNLLFAGTMSSSATTSSDFPEFNASVDKEGSYIRMRPPTALFLSVRF